MKVRLPKSICEAIETMRAKGLDNKEIVRNHVNYKHIQVNYVLEVQCLGLDLLIQALYFGFEPIEEDITVNIDPAKQKYIKSYYDSLLNPYQVTFANALSVCGIQIKGVNK